MVVRRFVRYSCSWCRQVLILLTLCLPASAQAYEVGDTADSDVLAPRKIVVVDDEATAALREREGRRVNVVYRFLPNAINEVESAFHSTFVKTRANFLDAVEAAFGSRDLQASQLAGPQFIEVVNTFQKRNVLFPIDTRLAAVWAGGGSDTEFETMLINRLREVMKAFIRSEQSPPDLWVGSTLRLVLLAEAETIDDQVVLERGRDVLKTNFVSLPRAKLSLTEMFPGDQSAVARYVASFVKPNCMMEAGITRELRARRSEGLVSKQEYAEGEVIVRRGQVIDRKAKAALDQLEKIQTPVKPRMPSRQEAERAAKPATSEQLEMLMAAVSVGFLLVLLLIWQRTRRNNTRAQMLPVVADPNPFPADGSWQQRALIAEQRTQQVQAAVRSGLMAHLARWLSGRMTQKLIRQRADLMDAHQRAAHEMAELEARLERVQAPIQERLLAYEKRISELEKELSEKGEENRELIKAKIDLVRKQLETQRDRNSIEFN